MLKISTAPHLSSIPNTNSLMKDVVIALLPAAFAAVLIFGLGAFKVIITSVAACVMFEYFINTYLLKKTNTIHDNSAIITGILLAFNLPGNFPAWMILIGAFVAIGIGKIAFGGLGKNIFNPALVGRVFLFISFPSQMTSWPVPNFLSLQHADTQTGATILGKFKHLTPENSTETLTSIPTYFDMFIGNMGGCIGEVSAIALLLGLAYMLYRKVINFQIPFYFVSTVFILTGLMWLIHKEPQYDPLAHILSGGLLLGAIFMATDYVTSPMTPKGKIVFAIGCGLLTFIFRIFGSYPEGVSFAILIMNAFVPLINQSTPPRLFGTKTRRR